MSRAVNLEPFLPWTLKMDDKILRAERQLNLFATVPVVHLLAASARVLLGVAQLVISATVYPFLSLEKYFQEDRAEVLMTEAKIQPIRQYGKEGVLNLLRGFSEFFYTGLFYQKYWNHRCRDFFYPNRISDEDLKLIVALGKKYFDNKQYLEAGRCYREAASHGHGIAQIRLGHFFVSGYCNPANLYETLYWYEKAAEGGSSDGENLAKSVRLRILVNQGDVDAKYQLADWYLDEYCKYSLFGYLVEILRLLKDFHLKEYKDSKILIGGVLELLNIELEKRKDESNELVKSAKALQQFYLT